MSDKGNSTPKRVGLSRTLPGRGFKSPLAKATDGALACDTQTSKSLDDPGCSSHEPNCMQGMSTPKLPKRMPPKRKFVSPLVIKPAVPDPEKKQKIEENSHNEEKRVNSEIEALLVKGFDIQDCDKYVKLLHEYNEVKDATQIIFGRLAEMNEVTVKTIHAKYGPLELE